ncbi:MAG: hypothetical protein N4A46_00150 [Schleiferiaceae bacterium]|nr:hypothetical protein [Schleiferiaceae bacterium]
MAHIFQIFKKHARIPKGHYTPEMRKSFFQWEDQLVSFNGYVKDNVLVLPKELKFKVETGRLGIIVIQDIIGYDREEKHKLNSAAKRLKLPDWYVQNKLNDFPEYFGFNKENRNCSFELFSLEKAEEEVFELWLRYKENEYYIGLPRRNDYKLYTLEKGKPIQIRINGKTDSTMSRGKERTYSEYDYLIEYLGKVDSIEFEVESKIEKTKVIPKASKSIDLRKVLY